MDTTQIEMLNKIYGPLQEYTIKIIKYLELNGYSYKWGYYNGHYIRNNDEWVLEQFPIPIITIKNICDIGIDLQHTFMQGKLKRENAIAFDFSILGDYRFEVYGIEDYLTDFYNDKYELVNIRDNIAASSEEKVGVYLFLESGESIETLIGAIEQFKVLGFQA